MTTLNTNERTPFDAVINSPRTIFVYGTLKEAYRGVPNAKLVSTAKIKGFTLHNLGWFPGIARMEDPTEEDAGVVYGELWEIEEARFVPTIAQLDRYEGVQGDHGLYIRRVVDVTTSDGEVVPSWLYIYNGTLTEPRIESGMWESTRNR